MLSDSHTKFSRRGALQAGLSGVGAAAMPAISSAADASRPNILWLVSEDNFPYIGAYGDRLAHTPTLDRLAAGGILYRHAYASAPVCAPSRFAILTGVNAQSCSPAQHMRAAAALPSDLRTYPEYMRQAGYYCTNNSKTDYNCDVEPARIWNESSAKAHWRGRAPSQPFLAVFNYMTTHESMLFRPTRGRVEPEDVRVPAYLPDTLEVRRDFASYYNLMEKLDGQVAERLGELEGDGLAEDTIVFYYSDHGGALARSKRYCYDDGLRCALIVRIPAKWAHLAGHPPGTVVEQPVCLLDLAPTLLSLAGVPQAPQMQGKPFLGPAAVRHELSFGARDRMDERYDFVRTVTDGRFRYIRNYMPHRPWGMHGAFEWNAKGYQSWERELLAGRLNSVQKRFFSAKPYEELYDLTSDRDQIDNRVQDPKLAPVLRRMRKALDRQMLAIFDNGFIPEGSPLQGYKEARRPGAYPLKQVMHLAQIAARGDRRKLAVLRTGLSHSNEVMRYWSATGLLILGDQAQPALGELAKIARSDASPYVRIAAAEALVRAGKADEAVTILVGLAGTRHDFTVRLQALNALTENMNNAAPALSVAKLAAEDRNEYVKRAGAYLSARLEGTYDPCRSTAPFPGGGAGV